MSAIATKLGPLRSHLGNLRRRRTEVRLATGGAAFAAACLATLWVAFAVDVLLEMGRLERVVSLGLVGFAIGMAYRRLLRPHLGVRESDLEMALLVESRLKIDSDLVAALQFESDEARRWGSGQLREAVVDNVADFGNSVDVFQGLPAASLRRRLVALAMAGMLWVPFVVLLPRHIPIFLERLFLASLHYPTATQIVEVRVNGVAVKPGTVRARHGHPLSFEVLASGAVAESAEVRLKPRLRADASLWSRLLDGVSEWAFSGSAPVLDSAATAIPLRRTAATSESQEVRTVFTGQTAPLNEPLSYQVFTGDAWTDPWAIDLVPLPIVSLTLTPVAPEYARQLATVPAQTGSQVLSVVDGSRVQLSLHCINKGLRRAVVTVGKKEYPLESEDDRRQTWSLKPEGTPFTKVAAPIAFSVQVRDMDDMPLEKPIVGHIRLLADREPRVVAAVVTERVLPTARPIIGYKATDDFGIGEIRLHRDVERADGNREQAPTLTLLKVDPARQPVTLLPENDEGLRVDLKPLRLQKGDKVRMVVEVADYRGSAPGKSGFSELIVFQVTDQSGILEGLTEADQKSARQLDVIIQRQLGIGDNR